MSILKLFEKYFSLQIYKIISKLVPIIIFIFINIEVLGGVFECLPEDFVNIIHRPIMVPWAYLISL